jgi:hypothetical protein
MHAVSVPVILSEGREYRAGSAVGSSSLGAASEMHLQERTILVQGIWLYRPTVISKREMLGLESALHCPDKIGKGRISFAIGEVWIFFLSSSCPRTPLFAGSAQSNRKLPSATLLAIRGCLAKRQEHDL